MKIKFILQLAFLFLPIISFAQDLSSISIFTEEGQKFFLYLDGEQKNNTPVDEMRVRNLDKPFYDAKIVFADGHFADIETKVRTISPRGQKSDAFYKIRKPISNQLVCKGTSNAYYELKQDPLKENLECVLLAIVALKECAVNNETSYSESQPDLRYNDYYSKPATKTVTTTTSEATAQEMPISAAPKMVATMASTPGLSATSMRTK